MRQSHAGRLTRDKIVAAVTEQLEHSGVDGVSTRTIGEALGVHPTALYRHFRDMDELLREAADQMLAGVADQPAIVDEPDSLTAAAALCRAVRTVLMEHPGAAQVMSKGPSRMTNERAVTERLLHLLGAAGLPDPEVAGAYHALINYTVGSAALDTQASAQSHEEDAERHGSWRAHYLAAVPEAFPSTSRYAALLYPSLEDQFEFGLELLLDGMRQRVVAGGRAAVS